MCERVCVCVLSAWCLGSEGIRAWCLVCGKLRLGRRVLWGAVGVAVAAADLFGTFVCP